jgi:phosphatidate cytidylyltransferase
MRQRSISAVGVVIIGIVPALFGGPVFAVVLGLICLVGLHEYNAMARLVGNTILPSGYVALLGFAFAAALERREDALLGACAFSVGIPLLLAVFRSNLDRAFLDWTLSTTGSLYLGIPLFAAIATRNLHGSIDVHWLSDLSDWLSFGWSSHPRGLAWLLFVIVVTWLSDTGAYLIGRATGRHPLIPRISPKKTIEGFAGGLLCAAATAVIASSAFGLDIPWWAAIATGLLISVVGVFGDLAESLLKRQAGVKDSGTLIPGHGGMLDRLDALLFTWTAGLFLATFVDRWV